MSYSHYSNPSQKNAYSQVDGNNQEYISNQKDLLLSQKHAKIGIIPEHVIRTPHSDIIQGVRYGLNIPSENGILGRKNLAVDEYHTYNPYYDFLRKKGLLKENFKTRIHTSYVNIDSNARITEPKIVIENEKMLDDNPLSFDTTSTIVGISNSIQNLLRINYPNNNLNKGDRIILSGLAKTSVSIRTIYKSPSGTIKNAVIFTPGSLSIAFICNYDENDTEESNMSFDPNFKIGSGIEYEKLKAYDTTDMVVTISGFDISNIGAPYVGNIPINFLNSPHRMYLTNPDFKLHDGLVVYSNNTLINIPINGIVKKITGFYIKLPIIFSGLQPANNMLLNLTFNHVGGIPINKLNAEFPIDENHLVGYHQVYSTTIDTIDILINKDTYYLDKINTGNTNEISKQKQFGGENIYIAKIIDLISGYSTPSEYKIELPRIIHNVIMTKLVSTIFPNTSKIFKNNQENKNNKLYWQNQDDGDYIYSIEIDPGNYNPDDLEKIIEAKVYDVKRQYSKIVNTSTNYTDRNYMHISIDINTNIIKFKSYKEAILSRPIKSINPEIPKIGDGLPPYTLTILQSSHKLKIGDTVLFTGLISTFGIPENILNTTHIITSIPTVDTYTIIINNFNLNSSRTNTGGGYASKSYVQSSFRLLFNYNDTMGNQLGFRNVGDANSITEFNTEITNADPYQDEVVLYDNNNISIKYIFDESGNKIMLRNNSIKLSGYDYVIMMLREFTNMTNICKNKNIGSCFAKINLTGLPGKLVYDTFVNSTSLLYDPIDLTELNISFYSSDGILYDFNGIDHSFVLEITALEYTPEETGIVSSRTIF